MAFSPPRTASAVLALGCTVGPMLALAPSAAAAEPLTVQVHCVIPLDQPPVDGPQQIALDGPTDPVRPGDKVRIKVTLGGSPATSPLPFPGTPLTPSIQLVLSGGAKGEVTLQGPKMRVDIPGTPAQIVVPPYEGEITVPAHAEGDITIAPGKMVTSTAIFGDQITTCFPTAPAPPAMTLKLAARAPAPDAPSGAAAGQPGSAGPIDGAAAPSPTGPAESPAPSPVAATGAQGVGQESAPTTSVGEDDGDDGLSSGAITAIVAGVLILAMAVATMLYSWRRHEADE
ncbi:hypothetical protein [Streptomyces sp. SID3343]|uniref:hypothetical protein n=1 Tax=Streptomyces sp. SID3343 TaxID=2690260 RepID=UPI0013717BBF|nr:hypothetical protein [Streptomyces sp. SID3343]MYW03654.1 hypothetical protein [Streptomyces sp. SID3343]